jgi:hypothetical protein
VSKEFGADHPSAKIWVTVFANVDGLAAAISRQGWNTSALDVRDFVKGFNDASDLVTFVDVDRGKEKADNNIRGTSPSTSNNHSHCKGMVTLVSGVRNCVRVILGASTDNGYARLLRQLETQGVTPGKVVLLEGPPFEWELKSLIGPTFPGLKFPGLFSEQKLGPGVAKAESGMKYSAAAASGVPDGRTRSPPQRTAVLAFKSVNPDSGKQLYQFCLIDVVAYQYVMSLKPRPCWHHYVGKGCKNSSCDYSHSYDDLTNAHYAVMRSQMRAINGPCDYYTTKGYCTNGDYCIFRHDPPEAGERW